MKMPEIVQNHSKPHPFSAIPGASWDENSHGNLLFIPPVDWAPEKTPTLKVLFKNSDWGRRMRRIDGHAEIMRNHTHFQPYQVQIETQTHIKTCFSPHWWIWHPKKHCSFF